MADFTSGTNTLQKLIIVPYEHLRLLLWPYKLTLYHDPIKVNLAKLTIGTLLLLSLIFILPILFKKAKTVFLGIALFMLFLAPAYSPVPIASMLVAERYLYFPSLSLSIIAAFLYEKYLKNYKKQKRTIGIGVFVLLMVIYSARTIIRNLDWKTPEKFWQITLKTSYDNSHPYNEMGLIYQKRGDIEKAIIFLKKAIEINPSYEKAYNNLGNIYSDMGKKEVAISLLKKAIEINPNFIEAYNNLGNAYTDIGKKEEAIVLYKKVIEMEPNDLDAYYNLGSVYYDIGKKEEAIAYFKKAIKINPRDVNALSNLGIIYANMDNRKGAIELFKKTIKFNPKYATAYFNLSLVYFYEKQYDLAIQYCDKAIELGHKVSFEFLEQLKPYRK